MVIAMAALSIYFMFEAYKLPIGWIPDEGPGGGFWPFWLSAAMLFSCFGIFYNWVTKKTDVAKSTEPFFPPGVLTDVGVVALLLFVTIALFDGIGPIPGIGVYLALPLFLLVYVRFIGGNSWLLTLILMVATPIATFLFFEIALKITLPKGVTEEFFYPLFAYFFN